MSEEFDENYVSNVFDDPSHDQITAAYDAMNRYEEAWWENEDDKLRAGYQVFEDVLLMSLNTYKEGLSALLRRPVSKAELRRNEDQLQKEVRQTIPSLEGLDLLYRETADVKRSQVPGLEISLNAAEDIVSELTDGLDFDAEENEDGGSDFRIK